MENSESKPFHVTLYEGDGARALSPEMRHETVMALLEKGCAVSCVVGDGRDFCEASLVFGQFEGGTPAVASGNGGVEWRDISGWSAGQVAETAVAVCAERLKAQPGAWLPWFPVVDFDRCTQCLQCLSFCLFGVYGVNESRQLVVQHPENCKTNCPACSRVCPEAAIMFPKYAAAPINGDVVREADLHRESMKVDISALLGGDIYALLRQRSERAKHRFSKERDPDKALLERRKCLEKLAKDIPAEVLMALPSAEEIQKRAQEAMARAQAARAGGGRKD